MSLNSYLICAGMTDSAITTLHFLAAYVGDNYNCFNSEVLFHSTSSSSSSSSQQLLNGRLSTTTPVSRHQNSKKTLTQYITPCPQIPYKHSHASQCTYTRLNLYVMRSLVNHWSPHTHTSHCRTTSSAAPTQMRARVSPADGRAPQGTFMPDDLPTTTIPISELGYQLRICSAAHPETTLHT